MVSPLAEEVKRFPIYWVPQRVGRSYDPSAEPDEKVFPIYWVPQRVGSGKIYASLEALLPAEFPIYWVPQRVGSSCTKPS